MKDRLVITALLLAAGACTPHPKPTTPSVITSSTAARLEPPLADLEAATRLEGEQAVQRANDELARLSQPVANENAQWRKYETQRRKHFSERLVKERDAMTARIFMRDVPAIRSQVDRIDAAIADCRSAPFAFDDDRAMRPGEFGTLPTLEVMQVLDADSLLVRIEDTTYWLDGVPTANVVDGQIATLKTPVEVLGVKRYESALGATRSVWHLRALPLQK